MRFFIVDQMPWFSILLLLLAKGFELRLTLTLDRFVDAFDVSIFVSVALTFN